MGGIETPQHFQVEHTHYAGARSKILRRKRSINVRKSGDSTLGRTSSANHASFRDPRKLIFSGGLEQGNMETVQLVFQLLVTGSAAFLAAWLGTRRFRRERWWERKVEAYTDLINALHSMKWHTSEHFDAEIEYSALSEEYTDELWKRFVNARREVSRIAETASFLVSDEIQVAVKEMERDLNAAKSASTLQEYLDEQWAAVDACIKCVKEIGAKELNI